MIQTEKCLLVRVPKGTNSCNLYVKLTGIDVPPNCDLLGIASELTEEQWGEVVDAPATESCYGVTFYPVPEYHGDPEVTFSPRTASGLSLLRSHGMEPETTLVIAKR